MNATMTIFPAPLLHPPFVALLPSLYDVPEIRARVESACP
jgi:hypothetical protein